MVHGQRLPARPRLVPRAGGTHRRAVRAPGPRPAWRHPAARPRLTCFQERAPRAPRGPEGLARSLAAEENVTMQKNGHDLCRKEVKNCVIIISKIYSNFL